MSELSQDFNGKWKITGLKHGQAGITIPAVFTYNGISKNINITSREQTVETNWTTPLGVAININDIRRVYTDVHQGDVKYVATDNFSSSSVKPVTGTSYSVEVSGPSTLGSNASASYTASYVLKVNGTERARQDVTADALWDVTGPATINGNVVTNTNSGSTAQAVRVRATFEGKTGTLSVSAEGSGPQPVTTYDLIICAATYTIDNGAQLQFTALYRTLVDGVVTTQQNVTTNSRCTWTIASGSSYASVGTHTGKVTNTNSGSGDQSATVKAVYSGKTATQVVTVKGTGVVPVYSLVVSAASGYDTVIDHTGTTQLVAMYIETLDGVPIGITDVTTSATWSVTSGGSYLSVNNTGSNKGKVTGTNNTESQQSGVVRAVYSGTTGTTTITVRAVPTTYYLDLMYAEDIHMFEDIAWSGHSTDSIRLYTNIPFGDWTATTPVNWIHLTPRSTPDVTVTFDNNDTGADRSTTITISAGSTYTGISPIVMNVTQTKEPEAIYARFKTTQNTTNMNSGQISGFSVESNAPWWTVQVRETCGSSTLSDWLSTGSDCYGEQTTGKTIYLAKAENLTVSSRTACVETVVNGVVMDTHVLTQERGMSDITITGTVQTLSYESQQVNFWVTSNQSWKVTGMAGLTPIGFSSGTTFDAATGYTISFTVPENTTSSVKDFTVTVTTVDSSSFVDSDSYSFDQGIEPPVNGWLRFSASGGTDSGTRHLQYVRDGFYDGGAKSAAPATYTFYVKTNTVCCVHTITRGLKLYDSLGREISQGATGGQYFGPTANEDWEAYTFELPANTNNGKIASLREFNVTAVTIDRQSMDFNWHDSAKMDIEQFGNDCYIGEHEIYAFMLETMQQLDETATTIPAYVEGTPGRAANCYYPAVLIQGHKHCTAYPGQSTTETMDDYIKLNGNIPYTDPAVLELTSSTSRPTIKYENWNLIQYPTANKPFEVYVPANTGYTATGATKEFDLTLTYKTAIPAISKTIHVTQEYAQVEPERLPFNLYVSTQYGGQGVETSADTVNTNTVLSSNTKQFNFTLTGRSSGGFKWMIQRIYSGTSSYISPSSLFSAGSFGDASGGWFYDTTPGAVEQNCMSLHEWTNHSLDCVLQLKSGVTNDFTIVFYGQDNNDSQINATCELTVHIV